MKEISRNAGSRAWRTSGCWRGPALRVDPRSSRPRQIPGIVEEGAFAVPPVLFHGAWIVTVTAPASVCEQSGGFERHAHDAVGVQPAGSAWQAAVVPTWLVVILQYWM